MLHICTYAHDNDSVNENNNLFQGALAVSQNVGSLLGDFGRLSETTATFGTIPDQ